MLLKLVILAVSSASFGLLVASGVFTVLVAVGLVPRFAAKTHTAHKVRLYEGAIVCGTILGCIVSIFPWEELFSSQLQGLAALLARILIGIGGLFAGIFVGCFAMAVAEVLNSIPIFARRIRFEKGLKSAVWALAIGKMLGSAIYFIFQFYLYE